MKCEKERERERGREGVTKEVCERKKGCVTEEARREAQ